MTEGSLSAREALRFRIGAAAVVIAAGTSCGAPPTYAGSYTLQGSRVTAPGCMGSPPSGTMGPASAVVSAPDANGTFTMVMHIGTGNDCVITLANSGDRAQITESHSCDATIAPPFFPVAVGTLDHAGSALRLTVRWSMTGAGSNTLCWADDVWTAN